MAIQRTLKHVDGLKELDALLDSLTDEKFRKAALRNAGRKAMTPVKATLISKIPSSDNQETPSSYKHYNDGNGYQSGDLKQGVKLKVKVNTDKKIKLNKNGYAKDNQAGELFVDVTFDNKLYGLAAILEHGRSKREATTKRGNTFHVYGHKTDKVKRDIGTFEGKNFVSETFTEHESDIVNTFKKELTTSIAKQAKKMAKQGNR
ncbi:hypothetical protein [Photobacterium damselae]|uniref:hypothetical protein n=1 Tax=Photobacterium damselae TaxID=38293 RepID=UPI00165DA2BC|nr:hypothetical protein [Photobacterium damselae]